MMGLAGEGLSPVGRRATMAGSPASLVTQVDGSGSAACSRTLRSRFCLAVRSEPGIDRAANLFRHGRPGSTLHVLKPEDLLGTEPQRDEFLSLTHDAASV